MSEARLQPSQRWDTERAPPNVWTSSRGHLPVLLLLFVGSGCAALIYEVVWFQLLRAAIGSNAVSLGVLLGTFMGGLCLGSVGLPYLISPRWHPLRVYALLELGVGLIGLALLSLLPMAGQFYAAHVGHGAWAIAFRALICAICLLPPTVLMGATLPAIARWMEASPVGVSQLGFFYGANIAGAVFGCLLAGFLLLRLYDAAVGTYAAAAINATVAVAGLGLAAAAPYREAAAPEPDDRSVSAGNAWAVYVAIGLSGLSAMGAEVVWTRQLSLLLGATGYTFSIILAVFLVGLGIGSSVGSLLARGRTNPGLLLGWCQLLLVGGIGWTALMVAKSLPHWPIDMSLSTSVWYSFQLDLVRCFWAILPAPCLWGASFPLALAAAAGTTPQGVVGGQDPGRLVGRVYAANTVGAIIGSLLFSILMITWLGTQRAQQVLIGTAAAAVVLMFAASLWRTRATRSAEARSPSGDDLLAWLGLVAIAGLAWPAVSSVPELPGEVVCYGRHVATYARKDLPELLYVGEGMNSSIAVSQRSGGSRYFHVSGKVCASNDPADMRMQRMLGHVPALLHPHPRSALVVGCGAGVAAGALLPYPDLNRIVICEIEPKVPPTANAYFHDENYGVVESPRVQIILDDARHYIATTPEHFDIITSDPVDPWIKGAATLYTVEYLELCKKHLTPGGFMVQWAPLYETSEEAVKSQIATFMKAFPNGTIWSNDVNGSGYDYVLLGHNGDGRVNVDEIQTRFDRDDYLAVRDSLKQVGFYSAVDLLATYGGQGPDLAEWLRDAQVNRDLSLRLEYLAGMAANFYKEKEIFQEIVKYRRYPKSLFVASDGTESLLREAIEGRE
jgi:spermidine synthase